METNNYEVNCSFCGNKMGCPENMLSAKKHVCSNCFNNIDNLEKELGDEDLKEVHIDVDLKKNYDFVSDTIVSNIMDKVFPNIWKEKKEDIKEMSKKEIAEAMFASGLDFMLYHLMGKALKEKKTKSKR